MGNDSFIEIMQSTSKLLSEYYMALQQDKAESFTQEDIEFALLLAEDFCWILKCIGDRMIPGES